MTCFARFLGGAGSSSVDDTSSSLLPSDICLFQFVVFLAGAFPFGAQEGVTFAIVGFFFGGAFGGAFVLDEL